MLDVLLYYLLPIVISISKNKCYVFYCLNVLNYIVN